MGKRRLKLLDHTLNHSKCILNISEEKQFQKTRTDWLMKKYLDNVQIIMGAKQYEALKRIAQNTCSFL